MVEQIARINFIRTESENDALLLEANLIRKFQPKYNVELKDNKAYPLVKITKDQPFPRLLVVRRQEKDHAAYFGPFPAGTGLKSILYSLRKIFPYATEIHHPGEKCFRAHLGLCPCASEEVIKRYPAGLKKLAAILNGQRQKVDRELEKEMNRLAKEQNFEAAARIKAQREGLARLFSSEYRPWEYEVNPNLWEDKRREELTRLAAVIPLLSGKIPERIEGFDIAHLGGKEVTASLVVFTDGAKDGKQYRRFKVRVDGNNDTAAMAEVLSRRAKRTDWPKPDLILVDGGLGQVRAARKAIRKIPVIGLAKKEEEIYLADGKVITLPRTDPGLQLLQRIRDEAHRFSRKYHFLLRKRKMLQ